MKTQQFEFNENRDILISIFTHTGEWISGVNLGLIPDGIILLENEVAGHMKLTEVAAKNVKAVTILNDKVK
ncbi:hypothetical protein LJC52_04535 [Bacteroidales bacterium OttesenSCG-928-A17]|nr:hypothetical protein [Bacteroidales bacterium OttesenSCG-928-A17]